MNPDAPLHPSVVKAFQRCAASAPEHTPWLRWPENLDRLLDAVEKGRLGPTVSAVASREEYFEPVLDVPELTLPQAVRLILHIGNRMDHCVDLGRRLTRYRRRHAFHLQEAQDVLEHLEGTAGLLPAAILDSYAGKELAAWDKQSLLPFLESRADLLSTALRTSYDTHGERGQALLLLAKFGTPPPEVREALWELALAPTKAAPAQALLGRVPGFAERLVDLLQAPEAPIRRAAAAWLARVRLPASVGPLRAALATEQHDLVRGAMLLALESLGVPLTEFLDRDALPRTADVPESLAWFPFANLPSVALDPAVITAWIVQAHQLRSPEANPLVRLYLKGSEELGRFVFGAWLDRDAAGTAHNDRGLLAVVAACGGSEMVRAAEQYLKKWYGHRAPQCKSILAMLASTGDPLAVQLVLGVSHRFRTKGIQQEAERLAHEVAERRGWTVAELADRMVPMAGLEPDGTLLAEDGTFLARVRPDFTLDTQSSDKSVAACRKELKTVAALQARRLYEAMVSQRGWSFDEWQRYLWEHPLLGFYCPRLVWLAGAQSFRPLSDGTLVDAQNNDVALAPEAVVTVAHGAVMEEGGWLQHLTEHEVSPLFPQFGRQAYTPEDPHACEVVEFRGHMVPAFTLRKILTDAGWIRGEAQSGGWFFEYLRPFPELELEGRLSFTGNPLPEKNRPVGLKELSFGVPLAELPPILLTECYHVLAACAAAGSGFDPGWEARGETL